MEKIITLVKVGEGKFRQKFTVADPENLLATTKRTKVVNLGGVEWLKRIESLGVVDTHVSAITAGDKCPKTLTAVVKSAKVAKEKKAKGGKVNVAMVANAIRSAYRTAEGGLNTEGIAPFVDKESWAVDFEEGFDAAVSSILNYLESMDSKPATSQEPAAAVEEA